MDVREDHQNSNSASAAVVREPTFAELLERLEALREKTSRARAEHQGELPPERAKSRSGLPR